MNHSINYQDWSRVLVQVFYGPGDRIQAPPRGRGYTFSSAVVIQLGHCARVTVTVSTVWGVSGSEGHVLCDPVPCLRFISIYHSALTRHGDN